MTYKNIYIAMRELTKTLLEINKNSLENINLEDNPNTHGFVEGRIMAYENLLISFNSMENSVVEELEND